MVPTLLKIADPELSAVPTSPYDDFVLVGDYVLLSKKIFSSYPLLAAELLTVRGEPPEKTFWKIPKADRNTLAWYLSKERRYPVLTRFIFEEPFLWAVKTLVEEEGCSLLRIPLGNSNTLIWKPCRDRVLLVPKFFSYWDKTWTDGNDAAAYSLLLSFLRSNLDHRQLDALVTNVAMESIQGPYQFFDQEWQLEKGMSPSFYVLRNLLVLGWKTPYEKFNVRKWYFRLCSELEIKPELSEDLLFEREIQKAATVNEVPLLPAEELLALFSGKKNFSLPFRLYKKWGASIHRIFSS